MSDSNRLLFTAVGIGLIVCSLIWGVIGVGLLTRDPESAAAYYEIQRQRQSNQYESYEAAVALTDQACTEAAATPAEDAQSGNKRDLCAQFVAAASARKAANYTAAQTWIGFFGLGAVIVTLIFNVRATNAAVAASQETKRSVDAVMDTERAWMLFDAATLEHHLAPAQTLLSAHPSARIVIKNGGKSPAWMRRVQCKLVALPRKETLPQEPVYKTPLYDFEKRTAVLPDREFYTGTQQLSEWTEQHVEAALHGRLRLVIFGFIEYEDSYGRVHETQFCRHWYLTQLYGPFEERAATAFWSPVGGKAYNYHT